MRGPWLVLVVSSVMLLAVAAASRVRVDETAVDQYHQSIVRASASLPVDYGVWAGHEVDIPPSATKLLRPNVLIAREYVTPERGGLRATLMVVQCADTRDMQGHYPPHCYPAHGWASEASGPGPAMGDLETIRYGFSRGVGDDQRRIVVYNLFLLPSGEATTSMKDVRRASSDYLVRPYGAAQVQVVLDGSVPADQHGWILEEMRKIAEPLLRPLIDGAPEHREGEPS